MSGGEQHRHIAGVAYVVTDDADGYPARTRSLKNLLADMDAKSDFFTRDYLGDIAQVVSVKAADGTRYIRTKKDGTLTDNLLRLPRYEAD